MSAAECIGGDCRPEWNWRRMDCPVHGAPESTREQEAYAEALALEHASVECRPLHDGVMSVIRRDADGATVHVALVGQDGQPLDFRALERRRAVERDAAAVLLADLADLGPEQTRERVASAAREAMRPWPQYDGVFDEAEAVSVGHRLTTKGGLAYEAGDVLLRTPSNYADERGITLFSLRRMGHVRAPRSHVRALGGGA